MDTLNQIEKDETRELFTRALNHYQDRLRSVADRQEGGSNLVRSDLFQEINKVIEALRLLPLQEKTTFRYMSKRTRNS